MSFSAELAQITLQRFLVVPMIVPGPARNDVTMMLQKARKSVRLKVSASKTTSLWQPSLTASHHHSELEIPARLEEEQATKSFAPLTVGVARCKAERAFFPARKPNF